LAGLGFIHLGFLAAGAAVAVPIVIHLLFRPRAKPVKIGTLFFLRSVLRDSARRRKIRRWILLLLRTVGVLLLALLFARPFRSDAASEGTEREVILLIDSSASMVASGEGGTPFAKAQQQAGDLLKTLPTGTAAHLAYFDATGVDPRSEARIDTAMKPGFSGTDIGKALAWARDIVVGSRRHVRQVFLWTDLQRCGLVSPLEAPFPAGSQVEVIDVGSSATRNLAVDEIQAEQTDLRPGKPVRVSARIFNAGLFPARDVHVKLAIEGRTPMEQNLTLEGRASRLLHFDTPIDQPGLHSGFVEIKGGDELSFDDRRFVAFETRMPERILLIDGEPGTSVFGNETYYLETALRLGLPGDESKGALTPFVPERIAGDGASLALPALAGYRMVVMCNVAAISREEAGALSGFVASGGSLVILLGDRVSAGAYAALEQEKLLPGRIGDAVDTGPFRPADWIKDHPILTPFADPLHGDLRTLRFRKLARIIPDPEAKVLATAQGGLPILVERTKGAGRCLMFAIPADNDWGEWAIHRLYLPIWQQVARYVSNRLPGSGHVQNAGAGRGAGESPGVTINDGHALVRNADPAESDVERTTLTKLRETYWLPEPGTDLSLEREQLQSVAPDSERPDELWRDVAWILLIVLLIETIVANKTYALFSMLRSSRSEPPERITKP
jgi:hypothetical protein